METLYWCPFEGHKYGSWKPTGTSVFEFSYKSLNSLLKELTIIFYSETRNVYIAKSQKSVAFLAHIGTFPAAS